jgi:hypothetical protein
MKRHVFAVAASVVLAGTFALAQSQTPQAPGPSPAAQDPAPRPDPAPRTQPAPAGSQDKATEVRVTGCLTQGSSPTVFVIENARMSSDPKTAEGKKYIVVMADAAGLRNQLNRQVTITGTTDKAMAVTTPPAGKPDAPRPGAAAQDRDSESDLPRFSAKTIVRVADVCATS